MQCAQPPPAACSQGIQSQSSHVTYRRAAQGKPKPAGPGSSRVIVQNADLGLRLDGVNGRFCALLQGGAALVLLARVRDGLGGPWLDGHLPPVQQGWRGLFYLCQGCRKTLLTQRCQASTPIQAPGKIIACKVQALHRIEPMNIVRREYKACGQTLVNGSATCLTQAFCSQQQLQETWELTRRGLAIACWHMHPAGATQP